VCVQSKPHRGWSDTCGICLHLWKQAVLQLCTAAVTLTCTASRSSSPMASMAAERLPGEMRASCAAQS
jgi:hypothetical protein